MILAVLLLLLFSACEKAPQVFSLNNFTSVYSAGQDVPLVKLLPSKDLEGTWMGMGHHINIVTVSLNNVERFIAELIDTSSANTSVKDTTEYYILFISVAGHPFIEIISEGNKNADHDFMLPVSTYLKIDKLTPDTIIVQMPSSNFTSAYLKDNRYNYFIPAEYKTEKEFPVYITEDPYRLAEILNGLCNFSNAFQQPDTLVRIVNKF